MTDDKVVTTVRDNYFVTVKWVKGERNGEFSVSKRSKDWVTDVVLV